MSYDLIDMRYKELAMQQVVHEHNIAAEIYLAENSRRSLTEILRENNSKINDREGS